LLGALAVLSLVLLFDVVIRGSFAQALLIAPWLLVLLWAAYVVWVASRISTDETGVTVQNLLRRTRVPWARVKGVELRWQLELTLDDGSVVRSFGGPSESRGGILRSRTSPDGATLQTGRIVDDWIAAGDAGDGPVRRGWDVPALIALAVIVVWLVCAVLVAGS
jgi:hypothetical protein